MFLRTNRKFSFITYSYVSIHCKNVFIKNSPDITLELPRHPDYIASDTLLLKKDPGISHPHPLHGRNGVGMR